MNTKKSTEEDYRAIKMASSLIRQQGATKRRREWVGEKVAVFFLLFNNIGRSTHAPPFAVCDFKNNKQAQDIATSTRA